MTKPFTLSYSQVSTYETCPMQRAARYVLPDITPPPSLTLLVGESMHKAFEMDMIALMTLGFPLSYEELVTVYGLAVQEYLTKHHALPFYDVETLKRDVFDRGEALLRVFQDEVLPDFYQDGVMTLFPRAVEQEFLFPLPCHDDEQACLLPVWFTGRIDVIVSSCADSSFADFILDWKSANAPWRAEKADNDQATAYALASQHIVRENTSPMFDPEHLTRKVFFVVLSTRPPTGKRKMEWSAKKQAFQVSRTVPSQEQGNTPVDQYVRKLWNVASAIRKEDEDGRYRRTPNTLCGWCPLMLVGACDAGWDRLSVFNKVPDGCHRADMVLRNRVTALSIDKEVEYPGENE